MGVGAGDEDVGFGNVESGGDTGGSIGNETEGIEYRIDGNDDLLVKSESANKERIANTCEANGALVPIADAVRFDAVERRSDIDFGKASSHDRRTFRNPAMASCMRRMVS